MPDVDPAATVVLMRDAPRGVEVLMVMRNWRGSFADLVVFPGGGVDDCDVPQGETHWDDETHRRAALRELAEETGILLTAAGARPAPRAKGPDFYRQLKDLDVDPATSSLTLISRWVTPEAAPRRFDTRFYLAACNDAPDVVIDTDELVGSEWMAPRDALERHEAGELSMILPTLAHLRWLSRRSSTADALVSAQGADGRTLIRPQRMEDGSILPIHLPAEAV